MAKKSKKSSCDKKCKKASRYESAKAWVMHWMNISMLALYAFCGY